MAASALRDVAVNRCNGGKVCFRMKNRLAVFYYHRLLADIKIIDGVTDAKSLADLCLEGQ